MKIDKRGPTISRRDFIKSAGMAGIGFGILGSGFTELVLPVITRGATPGSPASVAIWSVQYSPQTHLAGTDIAGTFGQFIDPLPVLDAAGGSLQTIASGTHSTEITMQEFKARMLPNTFVPGDIINYDGSTWVWGYIDPSADALVKFIPDGTRDSYIGPVVIAKRGEPSQFKFVNNLGTAKDTNVLAYKYCIDQTIHWANPNGVGMLIPNPSDPANPALIGNPDHYEDSIPAAVHVHGAEDPAAVDGGPESWFTGSGKHGKAFYSKDGNTQGNYAVYTYPNTQEAAPLWFHDHTLGATRLNVYAGLAGAYDLIDPNLALPVGLEPLGLDRAGAAHDQNNPHVYAADELVVPLVIQDRMFDTNGQLFYGNSPMAADPQNCGINPEHPYWTPEFFGDTIAVNGKVWPYLEVQAQRYRFYLINGSNARTYILSFKDSLPEHAPGYTAGHTNPSTPAIWQICTDQGYLDNPVQADPLIIMPGERADLIVDFSGMAGQSLVLNNFGPEAPLNVLPVDPDDWNDPSTTGTVLEFRVTAATGTDNSYDPAGGTPIRTGNKKIVRLVDSSGALAAGVKPDLTRSLTLVEIARDVPTSVGGINFEGGPLEVLVNNTKWDGLRESMSMAKEKQVAGAIKDGIGNWITELPAEGNTEVWEIINTTADSHPIHTHLVQFQLMNRQAVNMGEMEAPEAGTFAAAYSAAFPGGAFIPGYGSPLEYGPTKASGNKYGGNPDVTPFLVGSPIPPNANELGWKDTVMVPPGMVTRFVLRWAPTDVPVDAKPADLRYAFTPNGAIPGNPGASFDYVWHCHIVDHEDNEMMRPYQVKQRLGIGTRKFIQGRDY